MDCKNTSGEARCKSTPPAMSIAMFNMGSAVPDLEKVSHSYSYYSPQMHSNCAFLLLLVHMQASVLLSKSVTGVHNSCLRTLLPRARMRSEG